MRVFVDKSTHATTRAYTLDTLARLACIDLDFAKLISKTCDLIFIEEKQKGIFPKTIAICPRENSSFSQIKNQWDKSINRLMSNKNNPVIELWDTERLDEFIQNSEYSKVYSPSIRKGKLLFYNVSPKTKLFDFVIEPDKSKLLIA